MSVKAVLDMSKAVAELNKLGEAGEKTIKSTMKDIKSRGPGWIAKGVAEDYGISAAEVKGGSVVKLRIKGDGLNDLSFEYVGRRLTPTHFKMTPKGPRPGGYTIKATIKRGNRATLGKVKKLTKKQRKNIGKNFHKQGTRNSPKSPIMFAYTGNKKAGGTNFIPFQRTTQPGVFDKVIKTVGVPQMIKDGSGNTKPAVKRQLDSNIEKRFNHYVDRYMGK